MTGIRLAVICLITLVFLGSPGLAADKAPMPDSWTARSAVHFALANSPDAKAALQRIAAARAAIRQAASAFYPQLTVGAGYSRTDNPMYSFGNILNQGQFTNGIDFNDPGTTDDINLITSLRYRLFNGGRDQAGLKAAEAGAEASMKDRSSVLSRLAYEVVRSFLTIIQADETRQARASAIEAVDASLKVARARHAAGDLLRTELLNLEVQRSRARENLIRARHNLELAKRGFLNLLGLKQGKVKINLDEKFQQEVPKVFSFEHRPELARIDAMIRAAEARVRQAEAGYYPTADAFGSYQVDKGFEYDAGSGNSWMAGVRLNYTLFDGHRTSAAVTRAKARLAELRELRHKMTLGFGLEIEQARLSLRQAEERLQVTRKMVELAEESARLSRARFKQGVILSSDLIEVEKRLTDARVRHALALATYRIAVADLRRAVGLPQFDETTSTGATD
ncbi:MAG TPA: TolC family protein [Desulfobulbus sp.]|nr:TolC family protein [Desulfobulbus sp.]